MLIDVITDKREPQSILQKQKSQKKKFQESTYFRSNLDSFSSKE